MKTKGFQITGLTLAAATVVAFSTANAFADDTNAFGQYEMPPPDASTTVAPPPSATQTTPLSPADAQVLQLAQAKVSDSTIIAFIQNSTTVYGLDASQIVYLKQQGVSEAVINTMLNQRSAMAAVQQQQQQQQQQQMPPPDQGAASQQYAVAQPSTPAPSTVYVVPDSSTVYYNSWAAPYWNSYPGYSGAWGWGWPVGWGWGWGSWGWGWHGNNFNSFHGGFHSGFNSGFHAGATFHNGGGGFHGGGGFGGGFHK